MSQNSQNNNLNELNNILFDSIRAVKNKEMDPKEAQTIVNIATAITNNAKTQMEAFKMTGGTAPIPSLGPVLNSPKTPTPELSRADAGLAYAKSLGYESMGAATKVLGAEAFSDGVTKYISDNKQNKQ